MGDDRVAEVADGPRSSAARAVALGAVLAVAAFNALWRLGTADWKFDESFDGQLAWRAFHDGRWDIENGHPVAVRWVLGIGQELFGQNRFGVRFFPALCTVGAVWLLFRLGQELAGWWTGFVAAAAWAVLPRALVLGHTEVGLVRGDRYGYLEPFMALFLLAALRTGWRWARHGAGRDAVRTGLLLGGAVAFKPTALVVVLPVAAIGWCCGRRPAQAARQGLLMAVLAVVPFCLAYLPAGADAPRLVRNLWDFQLRHAEAGHTLLVDDRVLLTEPWWSHLRYQLAGMGPVATSTLGLGAVAAWTSRRRPETLYVTAVLATLLFVHMLTPVALPHYYLLWAPLTVLLAAIGLVDLATRRVPARIVGVAGIGALAAVGAVATARIATLHPGDYDRLQQRLEQAGVRPRRAVSAAESLERYLPPRTSTAQVGFGDTRTPANLVVIDPREVEAATAGQVDRLRQRALAWGLTWHQVGRLEAWWRDG